MADQHLHIHFSLADIERYLQGRMSAREMHELEKAALQDPFLADAIEGYGSASVPLAKQHLNQIAAALQAPAQEEAKVVALGRSSRQWWKIAAAVIILAGTAAAGWYVFNRPAVPATPELAQHTEPIAPPPAVPRVTDSFKPAEPAAQKKKLPGQFRKGPAFPKTQPADPQLLAAVPRQKQLAPATTAPAVTAEPAAAAPAAEVQALRMTARPDSTASAAIPPPAHPTVTAYSAMRKSAAASVQAPQHYLLQGTVLDNQQQPVANATVKPQNGKALAMTDDQGRFTLRSMDSVVTVQVSSLGHEDLQASIAAKQPNVLHLDEASESLADMVVTEIRSRKKAESKKAADNAYPAGGWRSFQEYVYNKLHKEADTTGSSRFSSGEIELEFLVNEDGIPYDLKVIRSFNDSLNNDAMEALKNGPRWIITGKKKRNKVTLHF
jgi:hypothetical protein